jgi:hypothetical protein
MAESQLHWIADDAGAEALADRLNGVARVKPIVVATIPAGRREPYLDVQALADQVGDLADVYVMPTGAHTWTFSDRMPDQTQVYGGAGRVYPVGHDWVTDPYASPLRFAYNEDEGERATRMLVSDALRMAAAAGLVHDDPARSRSRVRGTVVGVPVPERALVCLDGQVASISQELTLPSVALGRIVTERKRPGLAPARLSAATHDP